MIEHIVSELPIISREHLAYFTKDQTVLDRDRWVLITGVSVQRLPEEPLGAAIQVGTGVMVHWTCALWCLAPYTATRNHLTVPAPAPEYYPLWMLVPPRQNILVDIVRFQGEKVPSVTLRVERLSKTESRQG